MKFIAQRKLDELGRLVLPAEARIGAGVAEGDALDLYLDEQGHADSSMEECTASVQECAPHSLF